MARVNYRELKPADRRKLLDQLAEAMTTINTKKEMNFFLSRLLTESEIVMLSRRLQIAELLVGGRTYEQICRKLGVGTATIRDVDGWLTDAAYEYHLIRDAKRAELITAGERKRRQAAREGTHTESTMPGELRHLIKHDSRFILFRLLLGDFS